MAKPRLAITDALGQTLTDLGFEQLWAGVRRDGHAHNHGSVAASRRLPLSESL